MERAKRIANLWSWLPYFRAAGETEQLTTAAQTLGVSTSAISRTIKLLEEDVERELFDRSGRRVELNPAGRKLLDAVRVAMRTIDEALMLLDERQLIGRVHVCAVEPLRSLLVLPALKQLREREPALVPWLHDVPLREVSGRLARGELDVAFLHEAVPRHELAVHRLGQLRCGLYAPGTHPATEAESLTPRLLEGWEFVALAPDDKGLPRDLWPLPLERRVALHVDDFGAALCASLASGYLTVLPDLLAHPHVESGALQRLPMELDAALPLYAVHRSGLPLGSAAEHVAASVVERSRQLEVAR